MSSQVKIISFMAICIWILAGCSSGVHFQAPRDEIQEICENPDPATHNLQGTPISCESLELPIKQGLVPLSKKIATSLGISANASGEYYKKVPAAAVGTLSSNALPGLVVFIEPGTYDGNLQLAKNPDPNLQGSAFGALLAANSSTFPEELKPHLRTFIYNFTGAFLSHVFQSRPTPRYGHVYFVKGDVELKKIFLRTIRKAAHFHPFVDLFIVANSQGGNFLMSKDMDPANPANMTADEFSFWISTYMSPGDRKKIRAIFSTQSYMGSQPGAGASLGQAIGQAYELSFPSANLYYNKKVNYYPIHRDFVMFEQYYQTQNYSASFSFAKQIMSKDQSGSNRTQIAFPALKARVCIDVLGDKRCQWMTQPASSLATNSTMYINSKPILVSRGVFP